MDFQRLFKLRLVIARFGEMDGAEWWNTTGALSRIGNTVLSRGFPRTDFFAQSRIVFEVARARCREVFNPPRSVTLWDIPVELEDRLESECQRWCAAKNDWVPFFSKLQSQNHDDGAKKVMIPVQNKRNFLEVSGDIMEQVDPIFYSDPQTAVLKALGLK